MVKLELSEVRIASRCIHVHLVNIPGSDTSELFAEERNLLNKLLDYEAMLMGIMPEAEFKELHEKA